jgi:hypothetical protein
MQRPMKGAIAEAFRAWTVPQSRAKCAISGSRSLAPRVGDGHCRSRSLIRGIRQGSFGEASTCEACNGRTRTGH